MPAASSTTYAFRGKGKIFLALYTTPGNLQPIGNAAEYEYTVSEKTETLPDYQSASGGIAEQDSQIDEVNFKLTAYQLNPTNLAIALRGGVVSVATGSVAAETHTVYPGALCLFDNLPDISQSIVVSRTTTTARVNSTAYAVGNIMKSGTHIYVCKTAGTSAGSPPSFNTDGTDTTDGTVVWADTGLATTAVTTDWLLVSGGIVVNKTTGAFKWSVSGEPVSVAYTRNPADVVEALTTSALIYKLVFAGLNAVDGGRPVVLTAYRNKFKPASALALIQDTGYAGLVLEGACLQDTTVSGQGLSQYLTIKQPAAA